MFSSILKKKNIFFDLLSNSFWAVFDYFLNKLIIIVTTNIIVARVLLPNEFGIFSTSIAIVQTLWIITDFGVSLYGVREVAKSENFQKCKEIFYSLFYTRVFFSIISFMIILIAIFFLPLKGIWRLSIVIASFYLLIYAFYPDWYLRGRENFKFLAIFNFITAIFYLIGAILFIKKEHALYKACLIWSLMYIPATFLVLGKIIKIEIPSNILEVLKTGFRHINRSKYFFLMTVFSNMYISLPIYIAASNFTAEEVGYFNVSYRLYLYLSSTFLPISSVFYPLLSKSYVDKNNMNKTFIKKCKFFQNLGFIIGLPLTIIGIFFSKQIILTLYGPKYMPSFLVLKILSFAILIAILRLTISNPLAASNSENVLSGISIFMVIVALIVNYLSAFYFGLLGITVGVLLCEIIFLKALIMAISRLFSIKSFLQNISWKVVFSGTVMFFIIFVLRKHFLLSLSVGGVLYIILLSSLFGFKTIIKDI